MKKIIPVICGIVGLVDAAYLTFEHYAKIIVPCSTGAFVDCGKVLESPYATPFGVPLALIGIFHYMALIIVAILAWKHKSVIFKWGLLGLTCVGLLASLYFVYLQIFVIGAICLYCMVSAINSFVVFVAARVLYRNEFRSWLILVFSVAYKYCIKWVFFLFNPELIHNIMVHNGELLGKISIFKNISSWFLAKQYNSLKQTYHGIEFNSPAGLSAGFDYEARLTQILPALGFGFHSIGTITNHFYEGNKKPRLGRLLKSQSLMINKGFKNDGAQTVIHKLQPLPFQIPVGISIGRTNTDAITTVTEAINDIVSAFHQFETSRVKHSYYELNISCPNLKGNVSFYPPAHLELLLKAIDSEHIKKPVFIKMPIEKSNTEFEAMLAVIVKHRIAGIIVGNLQKDKKDPAFVQSEVRKFKVGNFSGKPTERRSNELIALTYKKYKNKLMIIGCGGIFNGSDAYRKIKLGASLVQLITGMIFNGPQLIAQINAELDVLLKKDGYSSITEAIGKKAD